MKQSGSERNEPKGFTLIELLVAAFLFSFLSGIAVNFVLSGIDAQRNVLSQQTLSNQMSYAAEYMTRALRQAEKELRNPPQCLGRYGTNYEILANGTAVAFIGRQGQQLVCREFFLENGMIQERIAGGVAESLTPATVEVTGMMFFAQGESQDDDVQPRVTFSIIAKTKGVKAESQAEMHLQTTVSQRRYDVLE